MTEPNTPQIPTLARYWNDPTFAAILDAEQDARRARFRAAMAPHDARVRAEQEMRWAVESTNQGASA